MMLLLVVLLGVFERSKSREHLLTIKIPPLFRKEGGQGGDFLLQLIQNQFPHHFNMGVFCIQCRDIVIRHTAVI